MHLLRLPFLILSLSLLLLGSCSQERSSPSTDHDNAPALWRIERDGQSAWVFGTIHLMPRKVTWETPVLTKAVAQSNSLVLEIANAGDADAMQQTFERLARSDNLPPLDQLLPKAQAVTLNTTLNNSPYTLESLSRYESWGVALLISSLKQKDLDLSPQSGVEYWLTEQFRNAHKPISGLETVEQQLGVFDQLPPPVQRAFLIKTLDSVPNAEALFKTLFDAWRKGDTHAMARAFSEQMQGQPELERALMTGRNKDWTENIDAMFDKDMHGTPFIAVGAGHLVGNQSLLAMLEAEGFRVIRVE